MRFAYQSEKLSQARRALMLPHSRGEAESIAEAFHTCFLGFRDLKSDTLDDDARRWFDKITEMMDTTGVQDSTGRGTWAVKAEGFSTDQKIELSRAVDELSHWFDRRFWEGS